MVYSLQQKYSFTTYSENNKARCKNYFLFVKMTMPICVNRKLLRMKSTAIQENNRNFKKNSFIPKNMFRPWPRGSATILYQCCHFWYIHMTSDVMFSDKLMMSDVLVTNLMLTGLLFFSHFLSFQDENRLDSWLLSSFYQSLALVCVWLSFQTKEALLAALSWD